MEILCAFDGKFLPHAATMLCSLIEHNSDCRVHLFHDITAERELPKLQAFLEKFNIEVNLYQISKDKLGELLIDKWASQANYYRLLAPRMLPNTIDKVIYLDSDIIVRRSLRELWEVDLSNHALAAVQDRYWDPTSSRYVKLPDGRKYFNSGVMLINLNYWRLRNIGERAIIFAHDNPDKVYYWDQDTLNALLYDEWLDLPAIWNAQNDVNTTLPLDRAAVVHFTGPVKPWHWCWRWSADHPFKYEYDRHRCRTPWPNYVPESKPGLPWSLCRSGRSYHSLYKVARVLLPEKVRRWLRGYMPRPEL